MITNKYKPKYWLNMTEYGDQKKVVRTLNKIRRSMNECYTDYNNILELINKYWILKVDRVLSKYSKFSRSVAEIEDLYEQIKKDLGYRMSYDESQWKETITKRVKLRRQKSGDKGKPVDLSDMPPLEGDEEKIIDLSDHSL